MDLKIHKEFICEALNLALEAVNSSGGPFGAVVVKDGQIISRGSNSVTKDCDPTAHAEINAIRLAGKRLQTHDLKGCDIYCSSEPCPMCLSAIYWSNISKIYFANPKYIADKYGFRDGFITEDIFLPFDKRKVSMIQIVTDNIEDVFIAWKNKQEKTTY